MTSVRFCAIRHTSVICMLLTLIVAVSAYAEKKPLKFIDLGGVVSPDLVRTAGRPVGNLAVADRIIIGLRGGVSTAAVDSSIARVKGRVSRVIGPNHLLVVELPEGSDILAAASIVEAQGNVAFAGPDRVVYTTALPPDGEYSQQWHLPKINAPKAWDITTGSSNVVIAFIDTGVDTDHPDITPNLWRNSDEVANNGLDDDHNGYVDDINGWDFYDDDKTIDPKPNGLDDDGYNGPDDQVNHGTMTASIAAAASSSFGTVGVSWKAQIMALKCFPDDGSTTVSSVVDAMWYAIDNGADIMNLSLGASYAEEFTAPIVAMWNRGGLTVSAAGNNGRQMTNTKSSWISPVCNDGPDPLTNNMNIGVAGLDSSDRKASWSNYDGSTNRNFVDVSAPGVAIFAAGVYYPSVSNFNSYFATNSGTSFSTPMVSGLAALLKAQHPTSTNAQIMSMIKSTCDNIDSANPGYINALGTGRINLARAVGAELLPGAPTNIVVVDTPLDDGGSITISWTKSTDDGAGSNKVTSYIISRATGSLPGVGLTATWEDIATVAKGTVEYADATTTDGVNYYYRVAAYDGKNRVESEASIKIQSVDDLPPPSIITLTAVDNPDDTGGAINLSWAGYTPSADAVKFNIYRDTRPFTIITGKTPLTTIANILTRTYRDATTVDATDYYYAITAADELGNETPDVRYVGPVQSYSNGPVTLPAGLQMLSAPAVPADTHPATLLGLSKTALKAARWNPTTAAYTIYTSDPLPELLQVKLGRGFFTRLTSSKSITPSGTSAPAGDFNIALTAGWHQLGNPFFAPMNFSNSTVLVGSSLMDLASAESAGYVRSYAWIYDTASATYRLVSETMGTSVLISPWQGFWLQVLKSCTLVLERPGSSTASATAVATQLLTSPPQNEWPIQLIASGRDNTDAINYFGVSSAQSGITSPPAAGNGVELYFTNLPGVQTATSFATSAASKMSWDFRVAWNAPQDNVTINWPDITLIPSGYSVSLVDQETGRRISMRHQTGYTFTASATTGERNFTIEATQRSETGLQITTMSVQPAGTGVQAVFTLSADASCEVTVMNIAGRTVRTLEQDRIHSAGINSVAWDGRNTGGVTVPSGNYLLRVTARADDGTVTSAVRSLQITR